MCVRFPLSTLLFGGLLASAWPAHAEVHVVAIVGFSYEPAQLDIRRGDSVQFEASAFHPLRSDDTLFDCDSTCLVPFPDAGTYGFHCFNHGSAGAGGMSGLIRVTDPDAIFDNGFERG